MQIQIVDGFIYFETAGFSIYVVVDESSEIIEEEPGNSCSCDCHSGSFFIRIF